MVKKKKPSRKSKDKSEEVSFADNVNYFISTNLDKIKSFSSKVYNSIFKTHSDKVDSIKQFLLIVSGYGVIINYTLHFLLGMKFSIPSLLAWGVVYYFISDEFVEWIRRIIVKK